MTEPTTAANRITAVVVKGVEGPSLYINDYRVAGNKPWGGGTTAYQFTFDLDDALAALLPVLDAERLHTVTDSSGACTLPCPACQDIMRARLQEPVAS